MESDAPSSGGDHSSADETVTHFSKDDTVERMDKPEMVGMIIKLGGDPDSSSDSDSESDEEDAEQLEEGSARVSWNNADTTVEPLSGLRVVDRAFCAGDIVVLGSDPVGQSGTVTNMELFVDLEYINGEVVRNVNSRALRRVQPFMADDYVVRDYWVGRVEDVEVNVTILFDDGAICRVKRADPSKLVPIGIDLNNDWELRFYPGMRVRSGTSSMLFKNTKWLRGCWKPARMEGTIVKVAAASVNVYWIGAGSGATNLPPVPIDEQLPKDVELLENSSHLTWQIGDHSLPPKLPSVTSRNARPEDAGTSVEDGDGSGNEEDDGNETVSASSRVVKEAECTPANARKHRRCNVRREKRKSAKRPRVSESAVLITRTRRVVDVVWQDGTTSRAIPASSLVGVQYPGETDFWPAMHVLERKPDDFSHERAGVVQSVDAKQRTARVRWFKETNSPEEVPQFGDEEVVSVYELIEHPDFGYHIGDLVIRLDPIGPSEEMQPAETETETETEGAPTSTTKTAVVPRGRTAQDVSFVGVVTDLQLDGDVRVRWGNGTETTVGPRSIFMLNREDEQESEDDSSDAGSWETVNEELTENENDVEEPMWKEAEDRNVETADSVDTAGGLFLSSAVSVISKMVRAWINHAKKAAVGESSSQTDADSSDEVAGKPDEEAEAEAEVTTTSLAVADSDASGTSVPESVFKHFDIVTNPSDHFYLNESSQGNIPRKWLKKVQAEWGILQNGLPGSIYVRIFEDRMDLLRAVIVGAAGTPYHDGLYVFDIFLPPEYPTVPPSVYYHSGGLRLNPNLYENGKVCLSLLNTWTGKGTELWNPGTSNILQVLISIQGLVLNAKPYFNEAGYDRQTGTHEGEKNSISYNENTFLLCIRSMMYLMRRPPSHFELFVKEHFLARASKFMACCKQYLDGVPVGYLTEAGERPTELSFEGTDGFKIILARLLPRLAAAFLEIGATGIEEFISNNNETSRSISPQA